MSVDVVREDFWQTAAKSTIRERCQAIFNQEFLSDVKFVVRDSHSGSESKTIPAHKFMLAISSPVFFAMFYGDLAEKEDSVEIPDCEYESLLELFRFIYSDEANLNPDNVMQLLYLAKKYMLPSLADKCSAYLQENLDASNVFHVLPDAQKYEEKVLLDHCWKVIEKETDEAVKTDGFMTIERSVLEELVERDSLKIQEVELFKAVDCWAGKESEKQGLVAEGSVKRRILGDRIVKGIRFPVMEQKEFADVVLDSKILSHEEAYHMVKYFSSVLNVAVGFSESKRARDGVLNTMVRFRSLHNVGWGYHSSRSDFIDLMVNKKINLHAVRLFGSDKSEYSVTLKVYNYHTGIYVATETGNFLSKQVQSEIGDYPGFDVVFKPLIALEEKTKYKIDAHITGPPSWYGHRGLSTCTVEHCGVIFSFFNCEKTQTTIDRGQFSEFVFTLD